MRYYVLRHRCGAFARRTGRPCRAPGNGRDGRCKLHGGKSTGPRTAEGKERIAEAQRKRWERWRAKNPRILPSLTLRSERRLLAAFEAARLAEFIVTPPPSKPVPAIHQPRLTRHALREAENARGRELMQAHREERQRYVLR